MIHLVFYDITSDKIRTRIAKRLIAEGYERIQYSVFAAVIDPRYNAPHLEDLKTWISVEKSAKLFLLKLSEDQFKNMILLGNKDLDIDFIIGIKNSIFI